MFCLFFFNDTATTEIYTLSLHDALPIFQTNGVNSGTDSPLTYWFSTGSGQRHNSRCRYYKVTEGRPCGPSTSMRSEEHTSELQSRSDLVCRLLLEKKKNKEK